MGVKRINNETFEAVIFEQKDKGTNRVTLKLYRKIKNAPPTFTKEEVLDIIEGLKKVAALM